MDSNHKNNRLKERTGILLFLTLVLSAIYSLVRTFTVQHSEAADKIYAHVQSDYLLMLLQCLLGIAVLSIPSIVSRKWKFELPNFLYVMYYLFLYCAIFLGEVLHFYYLLPHWDIVLHFFSGAMLGALGFILVSQLNNSEGIHVSLSPFFVALFAFCFALSCGVLWEIYEFVFDDLLGLNMQKFITATGEILQGHNAVQDTMTDLIVDAFAASLISTLGYLRLRKSKELEDQNTAR